MDSGTPFADRRRIGPATQTFRSTIRTGGMGRVGAQGVRTPGRRKPATGCRAISEIPPAPHARALVSTLSDRGNLRAGPLDGAGLARRISSYSARTSLAGGI